MTAPFPRWRDAIASATSDDARRTLLGEVARWRATHLVDIVGQREATWAIAALQRDLGDKEAALREARSLVSLCQTPPAAQAAEARAADALVKELGGQGGARRGAGPKKPAKAKDTRGRKSDKGDRSARSAPRLSPLEQAVEHGRSGAYGEAFKVLRGKGGPRAQLVRTWLDLKQALEGPEAARTQALSELLGRLEGALPGPRSAAGGQASAPAAAEPEPEPTDRVGRLLGRALPNRRAKALRGMQTWLSEHPGRADELAAAALLDHLDANGTAPAPWLAGFVAQASVDEAPALRAAMDTLRAKGSVALAIYNEGPFELLVKALRELRDRDLDIVDLRRGILRSEPDERRIWTLRVERAGVDAMIAVAPATEEPYPDGMAPELAKRLRGLCDRTVLVAAGTGNAGLRAGASVLDVVVTDMGQALDKAHALIAAAGPTRGKTGGQAPARTQAPAKAGHAAPGPGPSTPSKASKPTHAERVAAVREALTASTPPTAEALEPLVGPIKRVRDVLDLAEDLEGSDVPSRIEALVLALHRTAPERVRLLQATTLILKTSAADGVDLTSLLTTAETASRLGGPGVQSVVTASMSAQAAGWSLDRVLRGVTRRERREVPALDVLSGALEDLWRVLVHKPGPDGTTLKAEVWVADALPPEGQAGLPQLALRDAVRVGVVGPTLAESWSSLGGPPAVDAESVGGELDARTG